MNKREKSNDLKKQISIKQKKLDDLIKKIKQRYFILGGKAKDLRKGGDWMGRWQDKDDEAYRVTGKWANRLKGMMWVSIGLGSAYIALYVLQWAFAQPHVAP